MGYLDDWNLIFRYLYGKFKFCFYILVDNGLNVLLQICIFLKVICMYKYLER